MIDPNLAHRGTAFAKRVLSRGEERIKMDRLLLSLSHHIYYIYVVNSYKAVHCDEG